MSTENDVARSLRSWLRENRHEDADRVLDAVFDQVPATPQRRAGWLARRFSVLNNNVVRFGIAAAAVILVAIVGISLLPRAGVGEPDASPSPSASVADRLEGTWAAPTTACEQQTAAVEAAGFTAEQITLSGWTCLAGGTNHYSVRFWTPVATHLMTILDGTAQAFESQYRIVDDQTFEAFYPDDPFCLLYRYVIDGDQLTIEIIGHGCSTGDPPILNDRVAQTAVFQTSPFTRQP
jgi:hypothetical protein